MTGFCTPTKLLLTVLFYSSLLHVYAQGGPGCNQEELPVTKPELSLATVSTNAPVPNVFLDLKWLNQTFSVLCLSDNATISFSLDAESSIGDDGVFGGATILVRGYRRGFETTVIGGVRTPDRNRLQHILAFSGGTQTDATLQNISVLAEVGYIPRYRGLSVLDIGPAVTNSSWVNVGAFIQAGYTTSLYQTSGVIPAQNDEEQVDSSGALVRFKLGGNSELQIPVTLSGTDGLRFLPEAWVWYDVLDNRLYGLLEGTLVLDLTETVSYNVFSIKRGGTPPDFAPGTQLSTGLTIRF